jgi:uroporphyrinogen-III synthase
VAGLTRLGLTERISEVLPPETVPPAPGQGSLAIQCRSDDQATLAWVRRLDDPDTRTAVEAERAFLRASGGGCRAPIGALAEVRDGTLTLTAGSAGPTWPDAEQPGQRAPVVARGEVAGPVGDRLSLAASLAVRLADELESRLPPEPSGRSVTGGAPRVLVTRAAEQAGPLVAALEERGLDVVAIPTIELRPASPGGELDSAIASLGEYRWVVVTSANGARAALEAAGRVGIDPAVGRWASVGRTTTAVLAGSGIEVALTPARSSGDGLADELPISVGERVLLARADIADGRLPARLRERGAVVDEVVAYHTVEAPEASRDPLRRALAEARFDALVFTSGSTIRGLLALLSPQERRIVLRTLACCIGPTTAREAGEAGFGRIVEAPMQTATALADTIVGAVRDEVPA